MAKLLLTLSPADIDRARWLASVGGLERNLLNPINEGLAFARWAAPHVKLGLPIVAVRNYRKRELESGKLTINKPEVMPLEAFIRKAANAHLTRGTEVFEKKTLLEDGAEAAFAELADAYGPFNEMTLVHLSQYMLEWALGRTARGKLVGALEDAANHFHQLDMDIFTDSARLGPMVPLAENDDTPSLH